MQSNKVDVPDSDTFLSAPTSNCKTWNTVTISARVQDDLQI